MKTEKESSGRRKRVAKGMKIAIALLLLPLLPVAVAFNALGIADQLSFLPGIGRGGGVVAGVVMVVYVGAVVGVAWGGGAVETGGDVPIVGGGDEPVSTPERTPTPQPTRAATTTPTASPTPTPEPDPLERFKAGLRTRISVTMENETLTGIPILATEYRENDAGQNILWVVYWECDEAQALEDQRIGIGNLVLNTAGTHEGEMPDRVRVYGVTNLVNFEDTTTYINTTNASAAYTREMDRGTYTENWWDRQHAPAQTLNETAYQMVVDESGQERADEAFYDDHEEIRGCPGEAEVGTGSEAYDGN